MDFLKDIVKEIGGEYTQLASDIDETETYVDTGSYIFNALVSGSVFGGVSGIRLLQSQAKVLLEKLSSLSPSLKISLTIILLDIVCILILKQQSTDPFLKVEELTHLAWWLSMS